MNSLLIIESSQLGSKAVKPIATFADLTKTRAVRAKAVSTAVEEEGLSNSGAAPIHTPGVDIYVAACMNTMPTI